ncbi:uncharacterized protein LOC119769342 [Culex quinquefasciatus]|uniref:uncharacterized protein LOC119769342 n=1 Tax=Culex quinquefasciatus TaxID=7176 RepID=UPI0018E2BA38|nr:uncharacterized protein LOC119769342 [Culex quinquefasciatus]
MAQYSSVNFYQEIDRLFGAQVKGMFKAYASNNKKLGNMNSRKSFLVRCRKNGVFPRHITDHFRCVFPLLEENSPYINQIQNCTNRFKRSILNIEIKQTYHNIKLLKKQLSTLATRISSSVSPEICQTFFSSQRSFYEKHLLDQTATTKRKFGQIFQKMENNTNSPQPNLKAIHNGTNINIPPETTTLLSLGPKFALPITDPQQNPYFHLVADVENILKTNPDNSCQDHNRCAITNMIQNHLHKIHNRPQAKDALVKFCESAERKTRLFLKQNPNLAVLQSDKGNKTVIMNSEEYKQKMLDLLKDDHTYQPITRDPTSRFQNKTTTSALCPRIYGQPKAHKPGLPLRPVVPNITAPSYHLSKFVGQMIRKSIHSQYNVKNSFEFCEFINTVTLPPGHVLISLDVVSLFTCIPKVLVTHDIIYGWDNIREHANNICLDLFLELVEFCIDASYFKFNEQHYQQIFGTAMGNPLSSTTADLVMENLLDYASQKLDFQLPFLKNTLTTS